MSSAQRQARIYLVPESSSGLRYPTWQREYESALIECDPAKLFRRVAEAEAAIFNRLQALSESHDRQVERETIQDAITALRVIKRETLAFPDWD
jgi:hypothetical protein